MRSIFAVVLLLLFAHSCGAENLGEGAVPVEYEPKVPLRLDTSDVVVIEGTVAGAETGILVRIDDGKSSDYNSRFNFERMQLPGPFSLSIPVASVRTPAGRPLDLGDIRRVVVGAFSGTGTVTISRLDVERHASNSAPASSPASSMRQLGRGALPLEYAASTPLRLGVSDVIVVEGTVANGENGIVVRLDDGQSSDYGTQFNSERVLPPGPFSFSIAADSMRTSGGRPLDLTDIRRIVVGIFKGDGKVTVSRFEIVSSGAIEAPVVPGEKGSGKKQPVLDLGKGSLPIKFEPVNSLARDDSDEISIEGEVPPGAKVVVVLRIDDEHSASYATRFNDERTLPAGPFRWTIGLKGLKAADGRVLDHRALRRIILFVVGPDPGVRIKRFEIGASLPLPPGVTGYALGAQDAPLPPGFERIAPGDHRLDGDDITAVRRPAPDPLVANGLRGVKRLSLAASQGRARVTIWSEDPGEWENLPHPLQRRISVNGVEALSVETSAEEWIAGRYLAGMADEHRENDDAWTAFGRKRGQARSVVVDIDKSGIIIECRSDSHDGLFLSAVLVEPSEHKGGLDYVEGLRATWYRNTFPVVAGTAAPDPATSIELKWDGSQHTTEALKAVAAPDTGVRIRLVVKSDELLGHPDISLTEPELRGRTLPTRVWAAEHRLERHDTTLTMDDSRLISRISQRSIGPSRSRAFELWIGVPKSGDAGTYSGALQFSHEGQSRSVPLEVEVVGVSLPRPAKPAGFYLARPPHLSYFPQLASESDRQTTCDLDFMRSLGLTGTAPPVRPPSHGDASGFLADMERAARGGVSPNWLLYNPAQEVFESEGLTKGAETIAQAAEILKAKLIAPPLWTIADEPSNPGSKKVDLKQLIKTIRALAPDIKLAGHLNSKADEPFLSELDTAIVNSGFGEDVNSIERASASGPEIWLYNADGNPRLTAGLWLWRTAAKRYLQWHGRMPTADPFDPLDGREADFQVLYPMLKVCSDPPDIHVDLLRMAEGVVDQRWLLWLDNQETPGAKGVRADIRTKLGDTWDQAKIVSAGEMDKIRTAIVNLARAGK